MFGRQIKNSSEVVRNLDFLVEEKSLQCFGFPVIMIIVEIINITLLIICVCVEGASQHAHKNGNMIAHKINLLF